jgi:hypothetical protein
MPVVQSSIWSLFASGVRTAFGPAALADAAIEKSATAAKAATKAPRRSLLARTFIFFLHRVETTCPDPLMLTGLDPREVPTANSL